MVKNVFLNLCIKVMDTVNQEIFLNDLFGEFGEPIKNAKFNPAKIF